ncbi:hypothetical protein LSH36_551g01015 [Paralvinella palmiformis]|uniref:SEA domain-containing protein n=1 Tax=Paralvinella palmiformis TaxID=53620 RepID=A0AAD9J775_9ANNE|nr:hypothetical protein LSH36_551g01015 [Paralvinella palmiformis]
MNDNKEISNSKQEKDFEFEGENVFNPDAKIVDGTFLDDEDYLHDDGSTPESDDQVTGSGTGPTDIHTIFPTRLPTGSLDGPVFYRITLNFTNVRYIKPLGDRNTLEFQQTAARYKQAIEGLFRDIPGQQTVNVLQFRPGSADPDVYPPSMLVTADLGTMEYYYQLTIFNTLNGAINRGYVGSYEVSPHGFSFRPISGCFPNGVSTGPYAPRLINAEVKSTYI